MSFMHCATMGHLIKIILAGGTADQIAELSGHCPNTVRKYLRTWHRQRLVYVREYKMAMGKHYKPTKVWALRTANQPDAEKPEPLTNEERCARYKARKAAKQKIEARLARVRGSV